MQNPGIEKFSSPQTEPYVQWDGDTGIKLVTPPEPFIKVTHRRVAAPPPMATPYTGQGTSGGQVVPNEPPTLRQNPMTPPPTMGSTTPGPNATNGAPPILRLNDMASTPRMPDADEAAAQARITTQKSDGRNQNQAYRDAQQRVQERVQRRRAHPLHQGAMYDSRITDPDENLRYFLDTDFPPSGTGSLQPMFMIKRDEENPHFDKIRTPSSRFGPGCETCYLHGGGDVTPLEHDRFVKAMNKDEELIPPHEFKPHERPTRFSAFNPERGEWEYDLDDPNYFLHDPAPSSDPDLSYTPQPMVAEFLNHPEYEPHDFDEEGYINPGSEKAHGADYAETYYQRGQRAQLEHENPGMRMLAAQVPDEDPVYPYNPRENPEQDTVDLDNLQTGDDTYSNRLRPEDRPTSTNELLDRVFGPSTGEESAEHEQAARAHEQALNMMQGLPSARPELKAEDLPEELGLDRTEAEDVAGHTNSLLDLALGKLDKVDPTTGLSQAQMGHIDNYVQGLQKTHKQKVKELHDDWLARGGHKTGEPRPVERFSPRFTKPQRIVPMEGNMFPELESPIYHAGKCTNCHKNLFDSADASGDPRGAMGDYTYSELRPEDYGMTGKPLPICPNCENEYDSYKRVLDKGTGYKAGDPTGGYHWQWQTMPDGTRKNVRIDHTHYKDKKGVWQPVEPEGGMQAEAAWSEFLRTGGVILSDRVDLIRTAESDEEFWRRMEQEYPGQQPRHMHSDDASSEQFPDEEDYNDPSYEDPDMEDVIPENMSLRNHAILIRPTTVEWNGQQWHHPTYHWDGELRYPKYTKHFSREIRDSDDEPGHADEYHAIEYNTHNHGPVLPTEDNPEPHVLEYPWAHTYAPAGAGDEGTLTKGYNTPDQAMHAVNQLSIWGARHPESQKVLQGYHYVQSEEPYDPSVELPHEKAQRMGRAR